ncbi:MAG: 2-hydroxychromene-2-carboxylate isomerase [Gammaproteobacteria bacterium]|nr:2-hydroxychromene-2-carboxylate isomerase [Gammaproteobacteria bacterium]
MPIPARWYFDVISPYAYLHFKQLHRLDNRVEIEFVPVLFAGLLKHWGTKGPAELPAKRIHTYRQCVWLARQAGVPYSTPPRHPFNPLACLRLLIALGSQRALIDIAFSFIWGEGRDPEAEWPALCSKLGVADPELLTSDAAVKAQLMTNTAEAAARGVWGVPTFECRDELFWGLDTIDWMNAYLDDPGLFEQAAMQRASATAPGVVRRQ